MRAGIFKPGYQQKLTLYCPKNECDNLYDIRVVVRFNGKSCNFIKLSYSHLIPRGHVGLVTDTRSDRQDKSNFNLQQNKMFWH